MNCNLLWLVICLLVPFTAWCIPNLVVLSIISFTRISKVVINLTSSEFINKLFFYQVHNTFNLPYLQNVKLVWIQKQPNSKVTTCRVLNDRLWSFTHRINTVLNWNIIYLTYQITINIQRTIIFHSQQKDQVFLFYSSFFTSHDFILHLLLFITAPTFVEYSLNTIAVPHYRSLTAIQHFPHTKQLHSPPCGATHAHFQLQLFAFRSYFRLPQKRTLYQNLLHLVWLLLHTAMVFLLYQTSCHLVANSIVNCTWQNWKY